MFDSYGSDSDGEGGPGFSISWRGGEADFDASRFDYERPWALHEIPVSGDRDGYETPDPSPEAALEAAALAEKMMGELTRHRP